MAQVSDSLAKVSEQMAKLIDERRDDHDAKVATVLDAAEARATADARRDGTVGSTDEGK